MTSASEMPPNRTRLLRSASRSEARSDGDRLGGVADHRDEEADNGEAEHDGGRQFEWRRAGDVGAQRVDDAPQHGWWLRRQNVALHWPLAHGAFGGSE